MPTCEMSFFRAVRRRSSISKRNTEIRLQPVKAYPDYYPDMPGATAGGRVLEPVSFDGTQLGANFARLRPPLPEFTLFGGMMVNRLDIPHLRKFGRSFRSTLRSLRLISQYALQRLRAPRGTTLHLGNALAARLYASLLVRNVEILFGTGVERLLIDGDAVRGVRITGSSGARSIAARKGVVLATGGFSHDAGLREQFFPGAAGSVSAAAPAGTGDGLRLAMAGGASIGTRVADPGLLGAGVAVSARGWQPGRFPAYRDRPGEARRHRGQCVGKAFCQRSAVVPRVRPRHAARRQRRSGSSVLSGLRPPISLDLRAWSYQAVYAGVSDDTSEAAN